MLPPPIAPAVPMLVDVLEYGDTVMGIRVRKEDRMSYNAELINAWFDDRRPMNTEDCQALCEEILERVTGGVLIR